MKHPAIRVAVLAGFAAQVALVGCAAQHDQQASPEQSNPPQPAPATATEDSAPLRLKLPNGDAAPVDSIDTDKSGALVPPTDVHRLGWWVDSALPGDPGTTVVTGHINEHDQGPGIAGEFADLKPGDKVSLVTANGKTDVYVVNEVSNYHKASEFPTDRLNKMTGPQTLALITCGGNFVGPPLGYEDNVIAWASPA